MTKGHSKRFHSFWAARPTPPADRGRDERHPLHTVVTRICTLPPRLAGYLIERFSAPGEVVFDPFCGKGTVALEACLSGREGIGSDISPEAVCATRASVRAPSISAVEQHIVEMAHCAQALEDTREIEEEAHETSPDLSQFYHPSTLRQILSWRRVLLSDRSDTGAFLKGLLLGILHGKGQMFLSLRCSHSYSMSPNYVRKYVAANDLRAPERDVAQCLLARAKWVLRDGSVPAKGRAMQQDARHLRLASNSVHLLVTSPPYFSVHRYARDNWIRLWFLGHEDYRGVQKTLIQTSDVAKYRTELRQAFAEMRRVLIPGRHALVLVGDVTLRARGDKARRIKTAELLSADAAAAGLECRGILQDRIPRQYKVAGYMSRSGGIATERLLVLRKPKA